MAASHLLANQNITDQIEALEASIAEDRTILDDFNGDDLREDEIADFVAQIDEKELYLSQLQRIINEARGNTAEKTSSAEAATGIYTLSREQVSWLSKPEAQTGITLETSPHGNSFWFANITGFSNATKTDGRHFRRDQVEQIESKIKTHIGIKVDQPDLQTPNLRPLNSEPVAQHTSFNAYKEDNVTAQGLRPNHTRALVLEDTSTTVPVYLVAQICTHDQQQGKIYGL